MPLKESFGPQQPVGNSSSFALDTSPGFRQVYDLQATSLFPDLFYVKPDPVASAPVPIQVHHKEELELGTRVFIGSMTLVGLFIFYRCIMKGA